MNVLTLIPYVYEKFILFVLIMTRISALFTTFVLFRRDIVNVRTSISLSVLLSIYVLLLFQDQKINQDFLSIQMLIQMLYQSFLGFIAGFVLNIIFEIFASFGQIVSMQIGLGMASLFDPRLGNITTLTHFYTYSVILIFLFLNGHIFAIKTLLDSFSIVPIGKSFLPNNLISEILNYSGVIFSGAIMLAISIVIAILLTNFALAVMSKFSPQFNLFSIGINMTLILGLIFIYVTFNLFIDEGSSLLLEGMNFLKIVIHKIN